MSLKLTLTPYSKSFLEKFFTTLHQISQSQTQTPISKLPTPITTKHRHTPEMLKSLIYMSPKIRSQVAKLTKKTELNVPQPANIHITLYTSPATSQRTITTTLTKLYHTIHTIKTFVKNPYPTSVTIYLTSSKKLIPVLPTTQTTPLGPNEVNSGSTYVTPHLTTNGPITIWRKEELMRVTIHELLHSLGADYNLFSTPILNQKLLTHYNLPNNNNINTNEAYNEFNACLLTAALSATTFQQFLKNIEYERLHSIKLAALILQYQNVLNKLPPNTSPDWLFKQSSSVSPTFHQNTNVFSYYIAKTALLYNINPYLKFLSTIQTYPIFPPKGKDLFPILHQSLTKFRPTLTTLTKTLKYPPINKTDLSLKMTITGKY